MKALAFIHGFVSSRKRREDTIPEKGKEQSKKMQENLIRSGDVFFGTANDHIINNGVRETPAPPTDDAYEYWTGDLPTRAPLGVGYVPIQRDAEPSYEPDKALTRGTLFPGLDLPFMDTANKNNPYAGTPLGDLMAVSFAAHELTLYLDTHPRDKSAFMTLKKLLRLKKEAMARYTKLYGPVSTDDLLDSEAFTWVHGPWPWETPPPGTSRQSGDPGK